MNDAPRQLITLTDAAAERVKALVANSKYAGRDGFGEWKSTPILLQDHGDWVAFRNIKIRELQMDRKKK